MSGVKISALPVVASALTTDFFPVVQAGVTSKETLAQVQTLFGFSGGILALANGGTGANLTAANGAIPYSTASAIAFLAAGTSGQLFQSGGAGAPNWTTATYPSTASSSGKVIVSDGTNFSASFITGITALGAQSQALNMNSHLINNVIDPVSAQDAATKNYVDNTALTGTSVYAASAGSLGTVTQSGAGVGATLTNAGAQAIFALDGVNPPVGSNVLIKNTATGMTAANEGIYQVTSVGSGASNWILTRSTTYDSPTEINRTGLIAVQNGSTLANTAWLNTATIVTVDTTNFSFAKFGGSTSFDQITIQKFTSGTSTYTPTTGMQYCIVEIVGGGGGAGGVVNCANAGAGASGSGAGFCKKLYTATQIGANATVVIGAAGTGGAAGANNGVVGGNSTFTPAGAGVTLTASGGGKGYSGTNSATNGFVSTSNPDAPGTGTNGDLNISGQYGNPGQSLGTSFTIPIGGASNWGASTLTQVTGGGPFNGSNATGFGSGGSAGASVSNSGAASGGNGAPGLCIVTEFLSV